MSTPEPFRPRERKFELGFRDMSKIDDYEIIRKLGQGTFGVVQKATKKKTGQLVALKQLLNHSAKEGFPITAMREITILKQLDHINILKIIDMIYEPPQVSNPADLVTHRGCFYTVSEYMSSDLVGLLENPNIKLELLHIKCFMKQLLLGVQFIHENHFLHRDIKAANILIDSKGILKIGDFGLARSYHGCIPTLGSGPGGGERNYTGLVVTRWYRPPELLLGERKYTTAVDIWGVGCVFAELFTKKPILVGKSDAHQAQLVFFLVGSPNDWSHASTLPNKADFSLGLTCKRTLESRFKMLMPNDAIELLSGLLALDPYKRMNALDALNHEFFKNEPLPLKPHQLPKFEECHEIDKERFKKLKENSRGNGYKNFNKSNHNSGHEYNSNNNGYNAYNKPPPLNPKGIKSAPPKHDVYIPKNKSYLNLNEKSHIRSSSNNKIDSYSPQKPQQRENSKTPLSGSEKVSEYTSLRNRSPTSTRTTSNTVSIPSAPPTKPIFTSNPIKPLISKEPSKPSPHSANIFMNQKRKMPLLKTVSNKKRRTFPDDNDSELSDTGDVSTKDEEETLEKFLDNESFQKESEFRKVANERIRFIKGNQNSTKN